MPDIIYPTATSSHPPIPDDWIAHTEVRSGGGTRAHCYVVRPSGSPLHPFVNHMAVEDGDRWGYVSGVYAVDREEAMKHFRAKAACLTLPIVRGA